MTFWTDVQNYAYTKTHKGRDWGWEFLRRNPKYKNEWNEKVALHLSNKIFHENAVVGFFGRKFNRETETLIDFKDYESSYKLLQAKYPQYNFYYPDQIETYTLTSESHLWGIYLQNYKSKKLARINRDLPGSTSLLFFPGTPVAEPKEHRWVIPRNHCTLTINLENSVDLQFQKAIKEAKQLQKKHGLRLRKIQIKPQLWITYLRCLDANKSGESAKSAGGIIFPNQTSQQSPEDKFNETLKQARAMVRNGFKSLMM